MSADRTLTCSCGETEWRIGPNAAGTRVVCYCADCQSFANHLSPGKPVLDANGGTHVYQTLPSAIAITRGIENLRSLRLGPKGIFRWYAGCCDTPIANTLPKSAIPFVGMILPPEDKTFGKIVARAYTESARGSVKGYGMARAGLSVIGRAISGRLAGAHRQGPFFDPEGRPAVEPRVLTREQRRAARPT